MSKLPPIDAAIVNRPRPMPPDCAEPKKWFEYYIDLACWKADKAEALLSGVTEEGGK